MDNNPVNLNDVLGDEAEKDGDKGKSVEGNSGNKKPEGDGAENHNPHGGKPTLDGGNRNKNVQGRSSSFDNNASIGASIKSPRDIKTQISNVNKPDKPWWDRFDFMWHHFNKRRHESKVKGLQWPYDAEYYGKFSLKKVITASVKTIKKYRDWFLKIKIKGDGEFGISFGLRYNNFVLIDIQIGRVAMLENYFPGRSGTDPNNHFKIQFFYRIPKKHETGLPRFHPLYFTTKTIVLPCFEVVGYLIGQGKSLEWLPFYDTVKPVNDFILWDILKGVYIKIIKPFFE